MIRRLWLPCPLLATIDLCSRLSPFLRILQESSTDDDLVAHDVLMMVGMRGAVRAIEAVDRVTWEEKEWLVHG